MPSRASSDQWRKCRTPVKTMLAPPSVTAAITSWSRREPPGWINAVTPALSAISGPSGNGKNASLASTAPASRLAPPLGVDQDAQRLPLLQRFDRLVVEARRHEHLDEVLGDPPPELAGHRAVEQRHAAERRHGIRCKRALPRLLDRRRDGDAARVRVLDDHGGGLLQVAHH